MECCYRGDSIKVQQCLIFNQPIDYADANNCTGLLHATMHGHTHIAALLCSFNADPNLYEFERGYGPALVGSPRARLSAARAV